MQIKDFFVSATITDHDEARTARLINIILGCITVALVIYALVILLIVNQHLERLYLLGGALLLLGYIYVLNQRWQVRLAGSGLVYGTIVDVEVAAIAYQGLEGMAVQAIYRNVTERKQVEEHHQQLLREVESQRSQLRALNTRLARMEENERKRLAHELHDRVAQNLTGLNLNLNVLRRHLLSEVAAESRVHQRLTDAIALVEQTTVQIRNIMSDLRPPVLDDYGLLATLEWYAAQITQTTGLPVEVLGEVLLPRPAEYVELTLFRITQEALTNTVKHAQATQAMIVLTADNTTIYVSINDDGMGIDPARGPDAAKQQSWGLITMRERAEAIGGYCQIESCPFLGTSVLVEVKR